jgi:hypothetical protein
MNRYLTFSAAISVTLSFLAIPVLAANKPRAGMDNTMVWTNDDLDKLRPLGLISIVGRVDEDTTAPAAMPKPYARTQDPDWYAVEAARLRDDLERRQAALREYQQALEDARSLTKTTGGINFDAGDIGITPEAGIDVLQQRVSDTQRDFDALEDLARRNDIPPGTLRGQSNSGTPMDGLN